MSWKRSSLTRACSPPVVPAARPALTRRQPMVTREQLVAAMRLVAAGALPPALVLALVLALVVLAPVMLARAPMRRVQVLAVHPS